MKRIIFISIIQVFCSGYLLAQQLESKDLRDSIFFKKTISVSDSCLSIIIDSREGINPKSLTSIDSLAFKKLLDSMETANSIFSKEKSYNQIDFK